MTLTTILARLAGTLAELFALAVAVGGQVVPAATTAAAHSPRFMTTVALVAAAVLVRALNREARFV